MLLEFIQKYTSPTLETAADIYRSTYVKDTLHLFICEQGIISLLKYNIFMWVYTKLYVRYVLPIHITLHTGKHITKTIVALYVNDVL